MRFVGLLMTCAALLAGPVLAQDQADEDKGFLTNLIEENLSGVSRDVNIVGFQGALSSEASIQSMTISDADGIWLTLEDVVLDWNRAELLRGAIDVSELSAARIIIARPPVSDASLPSPEATPFALPDLPVSISLDALRIDRVELGPAFLGRPVVLNVSGNAALSGGEGAANLTASRLDGPRGAFVIDGAYDNATRVLGLTLDLDEDERGIAARLLGLPGRPSVKLTIAGTAPLDDYKATIALATAGQDRITGDFALRMGDDSQAFDLNIGGDVAPLFNPDYQAFFGNDTKLVVSGAKQNTGELDLTALDLTTQSLQLNGNLRLGAEGWPRQFALNGTMANADGTQVLLPLPGPKRFIDRAAINIGYDAAQSDQWSADIGVKGFDRPGLLIGDMTLQGGGTIVAGEGAGIGLATADLNYAATGLELDNAGAANALGDTISGEIAITAQEGEAVQISRLTIDGPGIAVNGEASIAGSDDGFSTQSTLLLTVAALERFSTLAGRELAGSGDLAIISTIRPLDGLFDVVLTGDTNDLAVGVAQLDPLLKGAGRIAAVAKRDTAGTRLEALTLRADAAKLRAQADITSQGSNATFDLDLRDISMSVSQLSGPATLRGAVSVATDGAAAFDVSGTGPAAVFDTRGTVTAPDANALRRIAATTNANISDLSAYAQLANRAIAGRIKARVASDFLSDGREIAADITAETRDIATGIEQLDPLLAGVGKLAGRVARLDGETFAIDGVTFETPAVQLRADGKGGVTGTANADIGLSVADAGLLGAGLRGPLRIEAKATRDAADVAAITMNADGPGTALRVIAQVAAPADNYRISGDANISIANLATYQRLVGQPVSGGVDAQISGALLPDLSTLDLDVDVATQSVGIGNPTADLLLRGAGSLRAAISRNNGALSVRNLNAATPNITISGNLDGADGAGRGTFQARLRDVGLFTDTLSGPVTANGNAALGTNGSWQIDIAAEGPGGIAANVDGQIAAGGRLNLDLNGRAPLGLANAALAPRRIEGDALIDLSINGPVQISSLTGRVDLANARLSAPTFGIALNDLRGGLQFAAGTANVDVSGDVSSGGTLRISGPVGLSGGNTADLAIALQNVTLRDPALYETTVDGTITAKGALAGGARIAGTLDIGTTEVRVPSSTTGSLGDLPDIIHVGANGAVRQTLERADSTPKAASDGATKRGPAYPLDITINAPGPIFVRGRGLDAELGGSLNLGGTTANVVPVGQFSLVRGRIDILQQRFELTEGSASLQGDFAPFLRLVATTETATGTRISIVVEGPASEPEVSFRSVPDLPQDEVLSQLIFGRDLSSISPLQAVQLAAAVSTLAGRGGAGLVDTFRQDIGLDDLDITTDEAGNAAVRAGKYLSENVYTDVTIASDGATEINLNLDITNDISAVGTVTADGETSIGIFYEKDY